MKHPNREEWVPYIFGEAMPDVRHRLSAHLESCPECQAQIAGWQRTLKRLDSWKLSGPSALPVATPKPWMRWAVAALFLLGIGFGFGIFVAAPDADSMRAKVELSVKTALAAEWQSALEQAHVQSSNALASAEARMANASQAEMRRLARGLMETLNSARQEDRQLTQALFEDLQRQQQAELISMRTDLETVASFTDEEIRQAQLKLIQIAAGNSSTP